MDSHFVNAAMVGDFNVISDFISNHSADELLQLRVPHSRNTILHLASQCGHTEAVKEILSKQSLLLCEVNSQGDMPLHLAAKGEHTDTACALISCVKKLDILSVRRHLAPALFIYSETNLLRMICDVPNKLSLFRKFRWQDMLVLKNKEGNTVVHEAIRYNCIQVVSMLLKEDPGFKHSHNALGETPLYIAASRGFHDLVDLVINASGSPICDGPCKRTALHGNVICDSKECTIKLLRWDKSLEYRKDKYSLIPLHYAAQLGLVNLVRELLNVDASIAYITTRERRNVLHIAIEHEQKDVIVYLLKEWPLLVNCLITNKDNEGNTPLHLLATSNLIVPELIHHRMADKGDLNKARSTPLDMVIHHNDGNSSTSAAKNQVMAELKSAGVIRFQFAPSKPTDNEKIRKMVDNHIIVAALIATVAFTAGFAMPGGYIQSGSSNQGMAVLSRNSVAFQAFVISDAVALICSTGALFMYFFSVISKGKSLLAFAGIGYFLNLFGLGAMIVAFIAGTYAVLQYSHALAVATSVVASCISFIVMILFDFVGILTFEE